MLVVATASWYFIFMLFELFLLPGKGLLILTMWFVTWNNLWAYSNRVAFNILFILQLETHGSNLTEEQLETHTISAWKEAKRQTYARNEGSWRANHHLVHVSCPLCLWTNCKSVCTHHKLRLLPSTSIYIYWPNYTPVNFRIHVLHSKDNILPFDLFAFDKLLSTIVVWVPHNSFWHTMTHIFVITFFGTLWHILLFVLQLSYLLDAEIYFA